MRVKLVSICPTDAAQEAGRPALTPELLAATGARYSRNNEGVEKILERVDPNNLDASVDGIFRMLDYGHQSIADMAPIAIFIDRISIFLAYLVWHWSPQAGGQESSTRYIRLGMEGLSDPHQLGIPGGQVESWMMSMTESFRRYKRLEEAWRKLAEAKPELMRIPPELITSEDPKDQRKLERLRRNFAFDRARYLLPAAATTNVMMVMSARAWATLCQHLASHPLQEARLLAEAIRSELAFGAPRLMKHATAKDSYMRGLGDELNALIVEARIAGVPTYLQEDCDNPEHPPTASLEVTPPPGEDGGGFMAALRHHDNRYAWIGSALRRTAVRFAWEAVAFGDIRDLNRHRTGNKHIPLRPLGFYGASDQLPAKDSDAAPHAPYGEVAEALRFGRDMSRQSYERLLNADSSYVYWILLGTQFAFEHITTADKFIYEAELRTGAGSHFRYAKHLRDALRCWYAEFPDTAKHIIEGTAEPE